MDKYTKEEIILRVRVSVVIGFILGFMVGWSRLNRNNHVHAILTATL